jgi:hypothetical protein
MAELNQEKSKKDWIKQGKIARIIDLNHDKKPRITDLSQWLKRIRMTVLNK